MIDFNKIKLFCVDVDGCLTDGTYTVSDAVSVSKSFYTRDFYALQQLLKNDIKVLIITGSNDRCIEVKLRNYRNYSSLDHDVLLKTDISNKYNCIDELFIQNKKMTWGNIAYIGDAENDLFCMRYAHYTACPSDAIEFVKAESNYISDFAGGKGCVYDTVNYFLKKRKEL